MVWPALGRFRRHGIAGRSLAGTWRVCSPMLPGIGGQRIARDGPSVENHLLD